jgi:hypothetical protein
VPLEDIALIGAKVESSSTTSPSPIRRLAFRLATELVATLTGKPLSATKRSKLLKAIRPADRQNELTFPNDEDRAWDDVPRMLSDAWETRDLELYTALCALEDALQLAKGSSEREVARKKLLKALAELARISSRPSATTRPHRTTEQQK